jgi:UDP-N-acetylglucosamine 4,6-dehydratase
MTQSFFSGKVICITWGTWSWWQELTEQLLQYNPKQIIIYSRWEHKQVEMKRRFFANKNIRYVIWDVRDLARIKKVTIWVDILFHLAALKHVPVCEENPYESVQTNITWVQNIIEAAVENNIKKVIDVSTDKAVDPFNIYGTCKAVWEKLIIAANRDSLETDFVCIRGGNVLGTNGSIVPLFIEQIRKTNSVTITNPEMTRFIMRLQEAIGLLIKASIESVGWEIIVMKMPAITVERIADAMIQVFWNSETKRVIIWQRPGEKNHELLVSQYEALNSYIYDTNYFTILPMIDTYRDYNCYRSLEKTSFASFASDTIPSITSEAFISMLRLDGWITTDHDTDLENYSSKEIMDFNKITWITK